MVVMATHNAILKNGVIINTNCVELESPKRHPKVQDHKTTGSGEDF